MSVFRSLINKFKFVRLSDGSYWNSSRIEGSASYKNIDFDFCMSNPIVFSCVNIRANYLSKVKFGIQESDGTINFEDESLNLINNPNIYQSKEDFLKQYEIYRLIYGWLYQKPFGASGFYPDALYNLSPKEVTFNEFKGDFLLWKKKDLNNISNQSFWYNDNGNQRNFYFKDVVTFFDVANIDKDNPYISPSRINSISKEINNTSMLTDAENRAIKTIGREVVFSTEVKSKEKGGYLSGAVPLGKEDKNNIKNKLNNTSSSQRTMFSEKPLARLDMSTNLKPLGINESYNNAAGIIVRAFGLNNEIYDYHTKGSTFENQEKAELRFIQNTIKPVADDLANSWTNSFGDISRPFVASVDHLPTMQVVETMRADRALKISTAIKNLVSSGIGVTEATQLMNDLGVNIDV